jgi:hypothetical protein
VQIGDEVVIMSAPGRFTIVAIDGPVLTLENGEGVRKTVHVTNVRTMAKRQGAANAAT